VSSWPLCFVVQHCSAQHSTSTFCIHITFESNHSTQNSNFTRDSTCDSSLHHHDIINTLPLALLAVRLALLLSQHMRRRNPHDDMAAPDYIPVSQDPENASSKRGSKSILPRSYNARRRLGLLAICAGLGLAMLVAVRLFQSGEGYSEEGTIVNSHSSSCFSRDSFEPQF